MSKKFRLFKNGDLLSFLRDKNDIDDLSGDRIPVNEIVDTINVIDASISESGLPKVQFYKTYLVNENESIPEIITENENKVNTNTEVSFINGLATNSSKKLVDKIKDMMAACRPNDTHFNRYINHQDNAFSYLHSHKNSYIK